MNRKAFQVAVSSLAMAAALAIAPLTAPTEQGGQRRDARDLRQDTRPEARQES